MVPVTYTLKQLGQALNAGGAVELIGPTVRYRSTNVSDFDSCVDWRANIVAFADTGHDVLLGYAEFLTVRFGGEPGMSYSQMFDAFSAEAEPFSELFDEHWLCPELEEQFDISTEHVVLVHEIYVEPLARGYQLGPWAIADIAHRMLPSHLGMIFVPAGGEDGSTTPELTEFERRRGVKLANHWAQAGLVPVDKHPDYLVGSAAFRHMADARTALAETSRVALTLTREAINERAVINDADGEG